MVSVQTAVSIAACLLATAHASAALIINSLPDTGAAPTGYVSNDITVDSDIDVTSAGIYIELATGIVYNSNPYFPGVEVVQQSPGDTYVTIGGNPYTGIAGAAGDLGHIAAGPDAVAEFGPRTLGASYYNTMTDDIGSGISMGTFSFSPDAMGRGRFLVFSEGETVFTQFEIVNGAFPSSFGQVPYDSTGPLPPLIPGPIDPTDPDVPTANFQPVEQSFFSGQVVNDLIVSTYFDWKTASVLIELDQGEVVDQVPTFDVPLPSEMIELPGLEPAAYDTYVGIRDDNTTSVIGGADNIAGGGEFSMAGQRVDVRWANSNFIDYGTFAIGRFVLTDDASGTAKINVDGYTATFPIVGGTIVPEPTTLVLFSFGAAALMRRRG